MIYYKELEINKSDFSDTDLRLIDILKEMLKICGEIYAKQINEEVVGSNFYPKDATKEEVLKAGEADIEILSPYTIVKRNEAGKLFSVPYSEEYKEELSRLVDLAQQSLKFITDPRLSGYIEILMKAARTNDWGSLEDFWVVQEGNRIDLQLAPVEPYMDGLLSIKYAFQGSLRVTSRNVDFNPNDYIETVKAIRMTTEHMSSEEMANQRVIVRVDDVLARAGDQTLTPDMGSNYPNTFAKVKELGTKILIHASNILEKEQGSVLPMMRKVLKPEILNKYTPEELRGGFVRSVLVHEIAEAFIKHIGSQSRLKEMYTPVKELHSSVMGMKIAAQHVLIGALQHEDYEAMLISRFVGRALSNYYNNQNPETASKSLEPYIRGYTVALNYLIEKEALNISSEGQIDLDFRKMFLAVDELGNILDELKSTKPEADSIAFFDKYEKYEVYKSFDTFFKKQ